MKEKIEVIVAGHICLDLIPSFYDSANAKSEMLLIPGKLVNVGKLNISTGGPVSNTGIALSILGVNTKLMGKIGNDPIGDLVLQILNNRNIGDGMIVADGEQTSYTVVINPPGFDRIFLHNTGANDTFCSNDINYDIVGSAKLFHFGYPPLMKQIYENSGRELMHIFKRIKEMGLTVSLDMSLPDASSESGKADWKGFLSNVLPYVDIFVPSYEELLFMLKRNEYEKLNKTPFIHDILENMDADILHELGQEILDMGVKICVIKCGYRGYYIRTQGKESFNDIGRAFVGNAENWADREFIEESFYVENIASAAGSGDNSIAGFLASFVRGMAIEEAAIIACAAGGHNLRVYDAVSGVKPWKDTLESIKGWRKNRQSLSGPYWKYDQNKDVWLGKKDGGYNSESKE
ncbi:MAG: carbohydrate kinase family protein [Ruminiclostridium sp.]|nr:carbohydrate kinase family protein [Ruminiclostridium sp.]